MPIDESKWNRKNEFEEYADKVYNFLNEHYPNAYTYAEIANGIGLKKILRRWDMIGHIG